MTNSSIAQEADRRLRLKRPWSPVRSLARFIRSKPLGAAGGILIATQFFLAIFAEQLSPYDPYSMRIVHQLVPPGVSYPLGTDDLGRDVLSRIIWGARLSLLVGFSAVTFGSLAGTTLGVVSGFFGGRIDLLVQRITDSFMAFPSLILALTIVAVLGPSLMNVVIAIAMSSWPSYSRVIRSAVLSVKEKQYIDAARAIGCSNLRIMLRHVLPQVMAPYIILATAGLGGAILAEASLSFLGLGAQPPTPSWGAMISESRPSFETAPWLAIFPGAAISLAVFGFNLLGDALRDVLDPRLRRGG